MRRTVLLTTVVTLTLLLASPQAGAITHGKHDTAHPSVGALLGSFDVGGGEYELFQVCTGSLMAPDLFLTATHCVNWGVTPEELFVSFDQNLNLQPDNSLLPANIIGVADYTTHPDFRWGGMSTAYNDVAVVELAQSVALTPVELPGENFLTKQAAHGGLRGHVFVNVGYGDGLPTAPILSPKFTAPFDGYRWTSWSPFSALTPYQLHLLANNAATGGGGVCFGDSGGPKFFEEGSNLLVAVTTSVDPGCRTLSQNQRLDTPAVHEFLQSFL